MGQPKMTNSWDVVRLAHGHPLGGNERLGRLEMPFQPVENYGVIGNMQSVALVGMHGSIDFLCYPEFDSPTVFAGLLDDKDGGCFQVQPQLTDMRIRQLYLPGTNI